MVTSERKQKYSYTEMQTTAIGNHRLPAGGLQATAA